MLKLKSIDKH